MFVFKLIKELCFFHTIIARTLTAYNIYLTQVTSSTDICLGLRAIKVEFFIRKIMPIYVCCYIMLVRLPFFLKMCSLFRTLKKKKNTSKIERDSDQLCRLKGPLLTTDHK